MVVHPITWLAISVWMEARGEPYEGKLGVAYVHMNRVASPQFPDSVGDVVWQGYQFSWTNPKDPHRMKLDDLDWQDVAFIACHRAACTAYYNIVEDPTDGATHYMNVPLVKQMRGDGTLPGWVEAMTKTAEIGQHTFYKQ